VTRHGTEKKGIVYLLFFFGREIKDDAYDTADTRLKHGICADQDFFMLYHWYRKNKHDMNKFYKLIRLTVTHLTLLKISRC